VSGLAQAQSFRATITGTESPDLLVDEYQLVKGMFGGAQQGDQETIPGGVG